jgi:acyl-CoA thioesterase-2
MRISSAVFLDLQHPVDTNRWRLPIIERTTGGGGSLFGGVGLAAGAVALEQATQKPIVWATGQYLGITQQPAALDLEVPLPAVGRNVTQGRVVGHLSDTTPDQEIMTVLGACGKRDSVASGLWLKCPEAPAPEDCPLLERYHEGASSHASLNPNKVRGRKALLIWRGAP